MDKLLQVIKSIQSRMDGLRQHSLKETPTRTIVIDPILEAMGWNVRDPDDVQLEYPTVDNKSVDYALKIDKKAVLLVEAKALDDPLNDVKAITQVVGYAANDGIVWCILTNGLKWKVYRSVEKCPAPEKLMFEVTLDPRESDGAPLEHILQQMWRFSRAEMAKGSLDAIGEQTFTDGKVRKALDAIMLAAPRPLLNIVRSATGDGQLTPQQIKQSIARIWTLERMGRTTLPSVCDEETARPESRTSRRSLGAKRAWATRRTRQGASAYDESYHTTGKPQEVLELYRAVDRICLAIKPGGVERRCLVKGIDYWCDRRQFCGIRFRQSGLLLRLQLKYHSLQNPPSFARDVSNHGYGADLELAISTLRQLDEVAGLIRQSFESGSRDKRRT